jgi:hypothetical protein
VGTGLSICSNGACCSWFDEENPCCGEQDPQELYPAIKIKKYAGPPGKCSASMVNELEDNVYIVPNPNESWSYCYEIWVPETSDECVDQVMMKDPAPKGGINPSFFSISSTNATFPNRFCPGEAKKYIQGPIKPGTLSPEDDIDAVVKGRGELTYKPVEDSDPAAVDVYSCPIDMGETDETICPSYDAVTVLGIKTGSSSVVNNLDPSSLFYDLKFLGTDASPEVSFKIDSPFDFATDMYIQYHEKVVGSTSGALDPACVGKPNEPGCNPSATSITA